MTVWVFKNKHKPVNDTRQHEAERYGDLWPMVQYLRAHEWSVFIVPPSERKGNMIYRVGTKLMSAEALTITYHRVHDRNERAKALAAQRQEGETPQSRGPWIYLPERPDSGGGSEGSRQPPKRGRRRPPAGTGKGGEP